jgi:Carboxypeptidase regulatory-like domain
MPQATTTKAILAGVTRAVVAEFNRDDLYVAEPPPGVALGQPHLDVLRTLAEDRIDDPGTIGRLFEVSRIVDAVQSGGPTLEAPQEARGFLSDLFERIVANVAFRPAPLSAQGKQAYDRALATLYSDPQVKLKTEPYQEFCSLKLDADQKDVQLLGLKAQLARATPEERVAVDAQIATLEETLRELRELIESTDEVKGFSAAKEVVDAAERSMDGFPASVTSNLDFLEQGRIGDPATNALFLPASFLPSSLSEANWAPMRLTAEDLAKAAGAENGASIEGIESIELEFQTLRVDRPWFWPALFENGRWDWKAQSPAVSNGKADPDGKTMLPAYVYALVFARNLLVKRRRASADTPPPALPGGILLQRMLTPMVMTAPPVRAVPEGRAAPAAIAARRRAAAPALVAAPVAMVAQPVAARMMVARPAAATLQAADIGTIERPVRVQPLAIRLRAEQIAIFHARFSADGVVVDETGQPVFGARVQIAGTERVTATGPDGRFSLSDLGGGPAALEITRQGFAPAKAAVQVPQSGPASIRLQRLDPCEVTVELITEDTQSLYKGRAQLTVTTSEGTRIEAIDDRDLATVKLPAGRSTLVLTVPGAEAVTPREQVLDLQPGERRPVRFTVRPAFVLEMRDVSLLAYVCRRVPASPKRD